MDRFEPNLRIPGPTALPPSVREAGARQMINHRGPEFAAMLARILDGMKPYFGTTSDVAMITTAGTGGLEAAVVNVLSPGDRVLGVSIGSFGDRFAKIARTYGADVTKIEVEWGQAADPAVLRAELERAPGYTAVLLTHNETSTGVMNPIRDLAAVVREVSPDALILVDSVSGLGARPVRDGRLGRRRRRHRVAEGLDVGSRPGHDRGVGASLVGDGDRDDAARLPRPPGASREPCRGPDAVHPGDRRRLPGRRGPAPDEHRGPRGDLRASRGVRCRVAGGPEALGFELFADPRHASKTVTAAVVPDDLDWKSFNGELKRRGLVLAGGQGKLTGKIFRLGHLGSVTVEEIIGAMSALEFASIAAGRSIRPGAAVAAAQIAALESYGIVTPTAAGAGA